MLINKKLFLLSIFFLFFILTSYHLARAEDFTDYFINRISAKDNYLFVLGLTPAANILFGGPDTNFAAEDAYSFFDIIDLRNAESVFLDNYIYKEETAGQPIVFGIKDKLLTIGDKYAFIEILKNSGESLIKVYDISQLPEVIEIGAGNIFPNAVLENKAFVITEEGISLYDISDVSNPIFKTKYLKRNIFKIEVEGNRAYIGYYNYSKNVTFLEILKIKDFSLKKIGKSYPLLKGKLSQYFSPSYDFSLSLFYRHERHPYFDYAFHVKEKYVYIVSAKNPRVLDTRNPNNIKKISSMKKRSGSLYSILNCNHLIISGTTKITILDISDPHNISVAGKIENFTIRDFLQGIAASEKYVIIKETPRQDMPGPNHPVVPKGDSLHIFEISP